ncbi:unnamed protein product [Amoebophrya sp. A120]|nr:unnamed protein product [Amoebophrya sp. A120]|eukprot:GSA120T00000814001.1
MPTSDSVVSPNDPEVMTTTFNTAAADSAETEKPMQNNASSLPPPGSPPMITTANIGATLGLAEEMLTLGESDPYFSRRLRYRIANGAVERPWKQCCGFFGCVCFFVFVLVAHVSITGISLITEDAGIVAWYPIDSQIARETDCLKEAQILVRESDNNNLGLTDQTAAYTQVSYRNSITFLFFKQSDSEIFTPQFVQFVCQMESYVTKDEDYAKTCWRGNAATRLLKQSTNGTSHVPGFLPFTDCVLNAASLANFFYGNLNDYSCPLLDAVTFSSKKQELYTKATNSSLTTGQEQALYQYFVDKEFLNSQTSTNPRPFSTKTRSLIHLGAPAPGYTAEEDKFIEQFVDTFRDLWMRVDERIASRFGLKVAAPFEGSHLSDSEAFKDDALGIKMAYHGLAIRQVEFQRAVVEDQNFIMGAIFAVWLLILFHTRSAFLASVAVAQISLTLPFALFWYRVVGQAFYFTQLHITGLFLACGIGADDVFVLSDCYEAAKVQIQQAKFDVSEPLTKREYKLALLKALNRAYVAVFNTSFTTTAAFIATAVSPIMPISGFGIYASLLIISNYIFAMVNLPAVLYLADTAFVDSKFCKCCARNGCFCFKLACCKVAQVVHHDGGKSSGTTGKAGQAGAPALPIVGDATQVVDLKHSKDAALNDSRDTTPAYGAPPVVVDVGATTTAATSSVDVEPGRILEGEHQLANVLQLSDEQETQNSYDGTEIESYWEWYWVMLVLLEVRIDTESKSVSFRRNGIKQMLRESVDTTSSKNVSRQASRSNTKDLAGIEAGAQGDNSCPTAAGDHGAATTKSTEIRVSSTRKIDATSSTPTTTPTTGVGAASPNMSLLSSSTCRIFPIPLLIAFGLSCWAIYGITEALQLEPPVEEEKWFPDGHMYNDFSTRESQLFLSKPTTEYVPVSITYGFDENSEYIDREDYNKWIPFKNRGTPQYRAQFDYYEGFPELVQACTDMQQKTCAHHGCEPPTTALINGQKPLTILDTHLCPMNEFLAYLQASGNYTITTPGTTTGNATQISTSNYKQIFASKTDFATALKEFRLTQKPGTHSPSTNSDNIPEHWKKHIGVINDQIKYISMSHRSTLKMLQAHKTRGDLYDKYEAIADTLPTISQMGPPIQTTPLSWPWYAVEVALLETLMRGLSLCFPISYCVLLLATQNWIISSLAMLTIVQIVGVVMGTFKYALGWSLGAVEVISGIIVIGFSIDYTLHMGHIWGEATEEGLIGRLAKSRYSLRHMGGTILAGASTTAAAGLLMFACTLTFFTKMATMISLTVFLSLVFTVGWFMSMLLMFGPPKSEGDFSMHVDTVKAKCAESWVCKPCCGRTQTEERQG